METRLDAGAVVVRGRGLVKAVEGRFWLTREGDSRDYVLVEGEELVLGRGRWVVEALRAGVLAWSPRPRWSWKVLVRGENAAPRLSLVSRV